MSKHICYFLFLLWLCYLIIASILLFTRGFLLTREVQNINSTCITYSQVPCTLQDNLHYLNVTNGHEDQCTTHEKTATILQQMNSAYSVCLPPKSRIILLVIDALRYDFATYDETNSNPLFYQNKLKIIHERLQESPLHSRLYKFIADPPTTTLQRLKGLTTGSLPTFIDAGSNFATPEITEDNIVDQLVSNNYSVVFMGDDTWSGLYPNRFVRSYNYPSFDVWDLDTVDNGVIKHLFSELKLKDWSLLIGHFLGVDHCGHYHGPNHPEMARKLTEMNAALEKVLLEMDNETMLIVIGDHGMTSRGEHGGDGEDEVTAGMFVYSKRPLFDVNETISRVKQVNLVPTLSTILGVPIPFQNLGTIIMNCLPITSKNREQEWKKNLFALWANVQQLIEYIKSYSQSANLFRADMLKVHYDKYAILKVKVETVSTEKEFLTLQKELVQYLDNLRSMCEDLWVQYDSFGMTRGLLFMFLSMFFVFLIVDGIPADRLPEIFQSSFVLCSYIAVISAAIIAYILFFFNLVDDLLSTIFFATAIVSQFMLVMLIIQNWEVISLNWYDKSKKHKIPNLICRLVLVFNLCGLFSNSFIVEESYVLLFLLITVIFVGTLGVSLNSNLKSSPLKRIKFKLIFVGLTIAILVRLSMYFWYCREEQHWCFASPHEINTVGQNKLASTKLEWGAAVFCLAIFVIICKVWLRNCGNLNGLSLTVTLAKYLPTVLVVCTAGFWVLQRLPQNPNNQNFQAPNILAWLIYGLSLVAVFVTICQPLCTYLLPRKSDLDSGSNLIPQLFNKVKGSLLEKKTEDDVPIVCGLGTVYSAVFIVIGVYLSLLFALLLGDVAAPSIVIMFLTSGCVLIIMSIIRIERADSIDSLLEIPNMSILTWVILCQYFFYGSGHQPTFTNINWDAAFIGTIGIPANNFVKGTLILLNTFCCNILMGLLLPLIVIAPFNIFVMLPSFLTKKKDLQVAFQRGEVSLYERDGAMITNTFIMCCKYILCHGIRVFASMLAATIHCRHLMLWKIFAPKFIFESIGILVTLGSVSIGFLVLLRVNAKVEALIISLNKLN